MKNKRRVGTDRELLVRTPYYCCNNDVIVRGIPRMLIAVNCLVRELRAPQRAVAAATINKDSV